MALKQQVDLYAIFKIFYPQNFQFEAIFLNVQCPNKLRSPNNFLLRCLIGILYDNTSLQE